MKKILALSVIVLALFSSCGKDEKCNLTVSSVVAPASEIQAIQQYLTANSITATQHPSGVFYTMTAQGTGTASPSLCSTINFKYKGMLTNGTVFDQSTTGISYPLSQLILGWQHVIPLMKKGGTMRCYIPPTLGYGNQAVGGIPANSILIFDIELVNF